jgi:dTDP-4-dehydrorhamnose reductase
MKNILVIGCAGQIGTELTMSLRKIYGNDHVIATDLKTAPSIILESGPFEILDILDRDKMRSIVRKYNVDGIINLAAIL